MRMRTPVFPSLGYRDARAAIEFLVKAFGFETVAVYPVESGDSIGHAELRWPAGGRITLHSTPAKGTPMAELTSLATASGGYPAFSIHVDTDDPDALCERAVAAGAKVIREVEDSPYGTRGFIVSDPEGLYWSFGTPLPTLVREGTGKWVPQG